MAEGYLSLLKRAIFGTYYHVSREYLHRYDAERVTLAIREPDGKRLTYRTPAGLDPVG